MDRRVTKLARYYRISNEDAQVLIGAGLDKPRRIKARKGDVDKVKLPKKVRDKIKAR